ncbi:hypothetical protein PVAND_000438 [Polypedilum vanderplanki]|uniref:Uncharacterized protein n=1 Tax=Polypedilum vanderplanki TaxID=319348 RepID=A0A9J6BK40_POLVA|nr:hypothetical protein PVAND_000438 [Polypedilum vanderplanki]
MATEAQRLISISLAKIASSRCVRGGVSLHKNLLVATVLQKARYIFMEEAFHMVHGHYINQANSKFIQQLRHQEQLENQLRHNGSDDEDDDSTQQNDDDDDSELDIFSAPSESLNFLSDKDSETGSNTSSSNKYTHHHLHSSSQNKNNNNPSSDLVYLDWDVNNRVKSASYDQNSNNSSISTAQKRRLSTEDDDDDEDSLLSIFPKSKQIKFSNNDEILSNNDESRTKTTTTTQQSENSSNNNNNEITEHCLSLDFLSNDLNLTSGHSPTQSSVMTPLDMSSSSSSSNNNNNNNTSASSTPSPTSSSIDRITSLVSIFNFGNLQRSVSTPDLCSSSSNTLPLLRAAAALYNNDKSL